MQGELKFLRGMLSIETYHFFINLGDHFIKIGLKQFRKYLH